MYGTVNGVLSQGSFYKYLIISYLGSHLLDVFLCMNTVVHFNKIYVIFIFVINLYAYYFHKGFISGKEYSIVLIQNIFLRRSL